MSFSTLFSKSRQNTNRSLATETDIASQTGQSVSTDAGPGHRGRRDDSDGGDDGDGGGTVNTADIKRNPVYLELCTIFDEMQESIEIAGKKKLEALQQSVKNPNSH